MLENSLRIRQRFINKLASKINELNSDIVLLHKVDRKISRSNRLQRGGAPVDLKELQEDALIKRLQIQKQNEELAAAISQARELTSKVGEINGALSQIKNEISQISVASVDLTGIDVPDVNSHTDKVMEAISLYQLSPIKDDGSLVVVGADSDTLAKHGHNVDTYKALLSKIMNGVYGLTVSVDDVTNLRTNLKENKDWSAIEVNGSAVVADGNNKKLEVTEKVYNRLRAANPSNSFDNSASAASAAAAAAAASASAAAGVVPAPVAGVPGASASASSALGASGASAPSAPSNRKYFW